MEEFREKQIEIITRLNSTLEQIDEERVWIEIAHEISLSETEEIESKLERILEIIIDKNKNLYNYVDNFWSELRELI